MSGVDNIFLEFITRILSLLPVPGKAYGFEPASTVTHSAAIYAHHVLCIVLASIDGLRWTVRSETVSDLFRRSRVRSFVACGNAFANICIAFGNLLMVDESYISLGIILIIFLIFIGAFFLAVVSPNTNLDGSKKQGEEEEEIKEECTDKDPVRNSPRGEEKQRGEFGEEEGEIERESSDDEDHIQQVGWDVGEEEQESRTIGHAGEKESSDEEDHTEQLGWEVGEEEQEIETKGHTGEKESSDDDDETAARKKLKGEEKKMGEVGEEEELEAHLVPQLLRRRRVGPAYEKLQSFFLREQKLQSLWNIHEADEIKGDHTGKEEWLAGEEKRQGGGLLWMLRLPWVLLCLMRYFSDMEMEMTNCLLFLSCSLGELAVMMVRLVHAEKIRVVQPALEVVGKAFFVMVGLLTSHTMAAELLGEGVVLVCMPELVGAIVWLTIYLGSDDDDAADQNIKTLEAVVKKTKCGEICLAGILTSILATFTVRDTDKTEGAINLIWSIMSSTIVAALFSLILPTLCIFVLMVCLRPSSKLKGPSSRLMGSFIYGPWFFGLLLVVVSKELALLGKL